MASRHERTGGGNTGTRKHHPVNHHSELPCFVATWLLLASVHVLTRAEHARSPNVRSPSLLSDAVPMAQLFCVLRLPAKQKIREIGGGFFMTHFHDIYLGLISTNITTEPLPVLVVGITFTMLATFT